MIKIENLFGVSRTITYIIIISSIFLVIGMLNSIFLHQEKIHYQIITPDGNYHLTTEIKEEDRCIIFTDELGNENRVCDSYTVKKI